MTTEESEGRGRHAAPRSEEENNGKLNRLEVDFMPLDIGESCFCISTSFFFSRNLWGLKACMGQGHRQA